MAQFPIDIKIDTSDSNKLGPLNRQLNETDRAATGAATASRALGAAIATVASASGISQLVRLSDSYTKIQNSIVNVVSSTTELTERTGELLRVANQSRSSFEATAGLYGKLKRATDDLGISQDRVLKITDSINKGFIASGASTTEASNAITQLAQGLSAGALRGDEFNSVAEQAPVILRAVSQETGKTIGQLREFAATGGITADILIRSIEGYADTIDREFARTAKTFEQQQTVARNLATEWVGSSDSIRSASQAAGAVLVTLAENLDTVATAATTLAAIYGARLIGQLVAKQAATAAANAATAESIRQEQLAAGAAVRRAEVEKAAALATLAAKREKLAATVAATQYTRANAIETQSVATLIPLLNAQARAQGAVAAATATAARAADVAAVATARLTVANAAASATSALAVATRALSGAMAFLGGPVGVAILAASALIYFGTSAEKAGQQARDSQLSGEVDKITASYEALNRLGQRKVVQDLTQQQIALNEELIKANATLARMTAQSVELAKSGRPVNVQLFTAGAAERVREIKAELDGVSAKLQGIAKVSAPDESKFIAPPKDAAATLTFYDDLTAKLQQQIALIGLTEVEQARLTARQELLNKAQKEGVTLTEAQITAYSDLAAQAVIKQQREEADKYVLTLAKQVAAQRDVGVQADINANLSRLSASATDEQRQQVEALTRSLYAQQEAQRITAENDAARNEVRQFGIEEQDPLVKLQEELQYKKDLLFNAYNDELIGQEEYNQRVLNLDKELADKRAAAQAASNSALRQTAAQGLDALAGIIEAAGGKQSKAYRAVFAASRAFALADSIAKLAQAQAQALADPTAITLPQKIANYAAVATAGAGLISSLKSPANFADGGYVSGPGTGRSDSIPAFLSNGEYIMPAQRTDQYRNELDAMRRGSFSAVQQQSSAANVTIINNVSDVADVAISEGPDGELIATIDRRIADRVPQLMAQEAGDPYSRFTKSINSQYRLARS